MPVPRFGTVRSLNSCSPSQVLLSRERRLALAGFALLTLTVPTTASLLVDGRTLKGISVWVKPLKFQVSVAVYLLTLAWFVGALPTPIRAGPLVRALVMAAVAAGLCEIAYITLQTGLGLASHYNVGDPFHRTMYGLMGLGAVELTGVSAGLGLLLLRHRPSTWATAVWLAPWCLDSCSPSCSARAPGRCCRPATGTGSVPSGPISTAFPCLAGRARAGISGSRTSSACTPCTPCRSPAFSRRGSCPPGQRSAVLIAALAYCAATALLVTQALRGMPLVAL
jgi:hypothetical protein